MLANTYKEITCSERGFSLIEVMISLLLVSIGFTGLMSLHIKALQLEKSVQQRVVMLDVLEQLAIGQINVTEFEAKAKQHLPMSQVKIEHSISYNKVMLNWQYAKQVQCIRYLYFRAGLV